MNKHYDLIVIGCGPGGYKSAILAAQAGYNVAIIEKSQAGGTCLNQGCVPKESLTRVAKLIDDLIAFDGLGLDAKVKPNFSDAITQKNKLVRSIGQTIQPWLKQLGIHYIQGDASFVNKNTINVKINSSDNADTNNEINIIGDRIIIATGSKPKQHPTIPYASPNIINSKDFMFDIKAAPKRVLFIGGGSIGTELGFVLHQFGSSVTISEISDRLLNLPGISERASATLERKFKQLGITVKKNTRAIAEVTSEKSVNIVFSDKTAEGFDLVIIAIGRTANTDGLQLENAGVKTDQDGFISTNEFLETTSNGIYAIGDVKQGPMTANAAFHDAKIATANALSGNKNKCNYDQIPIVIDSALQIASVGYTEEGAEDAGFEPELVRTNLAGSTIGQLTHNVQGFIEIVHDEETGNVIGGCVIGPEAREMIHTISAASRNGRGLCFFTDLNYAHPSWNEEFENTVSRYVSEYTPPEKNIPHQTIMRDNTQTGKIKNPE
ncbi:MAG: NAD(P)/FAD-dependent oxidoreductase [Gammaproteobacteria bacterium]|nr:NAD(P)/FAD-dependent oxidoreductase [Gammaproteobacteria bacterium]